jgi:hypothetical protein
MRLCRRGERGDAEGGRACDGFVGDEGGVERPGRGRAIPARKGLPWKLGAVGRTGSDDLTPIDVCSFHLSVVLALGLSVWLVGGW